MDEREWAEQFNRDLDQILSGTTPTDLDDAPLEYTESLEVAHHLSSLNFSAGSRQRARLEQRLVLRAAERISGRSRWKPVLGSALGLARSLTGVGLLLTLAVLLSWTIWKLLPAEPTTPANEPSRAALAPAATDSPKPAVGAVLSSNPAPGAVRTSPTAVIGAVESTPTSAPPLNTDSEGESSAVILDPGLEPSTAPLSRFSTPEEIWDRLSMSLDLWETLWADVLIVQTSQGKTTTTREQVWIDQPSQSLWISGPANGNPVIARLRTSEGTFQINLQSKVNRELEDTRLAPSSLSKVVFPAWSLARRTGTYQAADQEMIAGRKTVVVDYVNSDGQRVDRFWIDVLTGVILRWVNLPGSNQTSTSSTEPLIDLKFTAIEYDVQFTAGVFTLEGPFPLQFSPGYQTGSSSP
jgi:hypothetical protein